jgi:hypothetical protein
MTDLRDVGRYHRYRAEKFQYHAAHPKAAETRELYIRLARTEEALAGHFEQQLRRSGHPTCAIAWSNASC